MAEANGVDLVIFYDKIDESTATSLQSALQSLWSFAETHDQGLISAIKRTEDPEEVVGRIDGAGPGLMLIPIASQTSKLLVETVLLNHRPAESDDNLAFSVHWVVLPDLGDEMLSVLVDSKLPMVRLDPAVDDAIERAAREIYNGIAADSLQGLPQHPDAYWDLPPAIAEVFIEASVSPSPALIRLLMHAVESLPRKNIAQDKLSSSTLYFALMAQAQHAIDPDQASWVLSNRLLDENPDGVEAFEADFFRVPFGAAEG